MKYGVYFIPVWGYRDEVNEFGEYVADVDSGIVPVESHTGYIRVGKHLSLPASEFMPFNDNAAWLPDDTLDLRWWSFDTEQEAQEHKEYITAHFHNPLPWESFVEMRNETRKEVAA